MSHHQLLLLSIGLTKDGQIGEYHNGAGYPERNWARYDGIVFVNHKCALLRMLHNEQRVLLRCVPANENGQEREQRRRYPCIKQHNADYTFRHANRILERLNNGIISENWEWIRNESRSILPFRVRGIFTYPPICSINAVCSLLRSTRPGCSTDRTEKG